MTGGIKTKAGKNRIIPISNKIMPFIRRRCSQNKQYLVEENEKPLTYAVYSKRWAKLMEELNMQHLPHDGRHTFATMADELEVDKLAVKKIMGHAASDITDKVYTHKNISALVKAVDCL